MKRKLEEYRANVLVETCKHCETALPQKVDAYDHPGGWEVDGYEQRQWLSLRCPRCEYEWSLWKLGVPQPD